MRRFFPWLVIVGFGLLLVGGCALLFEKETVEEEIGLQGEAAYNPFFAAELFFERLGVSMERPSSWRDLPPEGHTILLPSHSAETPVPAERLHAWVRSGGHLVVAGSTGFDILSVARGGEDSPGETEEEAAAGEAPEEEAPGGEESGGDLTDGEGSDEEEILRDPPPADPLLEPLGLAILPFGVPIPFAEEAAEERDLEMDRGTWSVGIGRRVGISLDRTTDLQVPEPEGEDRLIFSLVRLPLGDGWVTVVSDARFLTNPRIGDLDHAAFAWDLIAPPHRIPEGLTVFYRVGYPSWFKLLAAHGWKALLSGAVALGLFLWSRGSRFGPMASAEAPERRSLLEHVRATGDFLWRNRLGEVLLQSSRATLLREANRLDPVLSRLPEKERVRHLASQAGISGGQLAAALEDRTVEDPAQFTRIMTTLESVRRAIRGRLDPSTGDEHDLA